MAACLATEAYVADNVPVLRGIWRASGCVVVFVLGASALSYPASAGPISVLREPHVIPPDGDRKVEIPLCRIEQDRDCIQSLTILRGGKLIQTRLAADPKGPNSGWSYRGASGKEINFSLWAELTPTGVVEPWGGRLPGARFWIQREGDADSPARDESNLDCSSGDVAACTLWSPPLPREDRVEIVFRSSWIRPLNVAVRGRDFVYKTERIAGGTLFTMAASQDLIPRITNPEGTPIEKWESDAWEAYLNFIIDHAGTSQADSAYDPRCADFGAPVAGHNAPGAGQPHWDHQTNSLNFNIQAPHRGPDGQVYRGFFQAQIPMSWLKCESGRRDLRASGFSIRVVSEDGEEQVATTALKARKGILYVQAFGFHYSSPTVQIVSKKKKR